jgi:hypothetical protein
VFVACAARSNPVLVFPERGDKETGLREQPFCATVNARIRFQSGRNQLVKSGDVLRLPAKLIVKPQHFVDEAGPDSKWQGAGLTQGGIRGCLRDRFAVERVQPHRRILHSRVKLVVQLIARDE